MVRAISRMQGAGWRMQDAGCRMQGADSALARLFLVGTVNLPCPADRLISFQFTSKGRVTFTEVRGPLGGPRDQAGGWAYSKCLYLLSFSAALIVVLKCFQIKKPDWYRGLSIRLF